VIHCYSFLAQSGITILSADLAHNGWQIDVQW
jgi:hypothetical protein